MVVEAKPENPEHLCKPELNAIGYNKCQESKLKGTFAREFVRYYFIKQ